MWDIKFIARNIVWGLHRDQFLGQSVSIFFFLCFLEGTDMANCVEDTTRCNANLTQELAINEHGETYILFKWFDNNYMNVSSDKSHYLKSIKRVIANIDNNRTGSQDIHGQDIFD